MKTNKYLVTPLRVLAYLTIISGLLALVFEVHYFSDNSLQVFWARYIAIAVAFWVLFFTFSEYVEKYVVVLIHTLLISIIGSFGIMIYILPSTVLINSSIAALTVFTSAVFLSWDVKHQTLAAIYYNISFAAAIFLNRIDIYFQPNLLESVVLVSFLSSLSIVACAVNNKLRKELMQKSNQVLESEKKFRHIFESTREGIFRLSSDFQFLIANSSLKKIIGYDKAKDIRNINFIEDLIYDEKERETLRKLIDEETELSNLIVKMKRDGQFITANLNIHRFKEDEGNTVYFEGSMQDITESEKMKSELIKAKESAEIANRLKTEFLAQMSHEIRTPIHVLLAFTNLMKEEMNESTENGTQENFEIIDSAGNRIIRTIDLILNMSELQTGTYEKVLKKFDIYKDVIRRLHSEFTTQAEVKGLKISVKKMTDETYLIADQYSVEQIFSNLLSNAIKYTNKGIIEIAVNRNHPSKLEVMVTDSGIGISEEYLSQIFDAFSQEETGYSRRFEGNGLGLALVKKYCELNDAAISVTSKKGEGSTFKVIFN